MIKKLTQFLISFLISLVTTWVLGWVIITQKHYMEDSWLTLGYGVVNAIITTGLLSIVLLPFFALIKRANFFTVLIHLVLCVFLLVELISLFYFTMTLELLGNTIFQFSFDQASIILDNYFVFKWYYLLLPFPILLYFILINKLKISKARIVFYLLLCCAIPSVFVKLQLKTSNGSFSDLPVNKTIYFVKSVIDSKKEKRTSMYSEDVAFYQSATNSKLQNSKYPLYQEVYEENTLAPFFELTDKPPNIVFMVVESLSSSFSGPEADEISYTPFLDSLAEHSLYFDNSLATSERSFAVLPSMLGSLPHGKAGFTNNKNGYPNNETLATWLFANDYQGDFHFGGYARFDYMDLFMDNQGFKNIYDRKEYNYEGTGLRTSIDSIPFGIPDKQFLKSVLKRTKARDSENPFIDVYLTLSMHYPYMIEDHEAYYKKVKSIIKQADVSPNIKEKHKKYVAEFATFLYTDDALKSYFKKQENRAEHKNTIYVILGDHMMGELPQSTHIEKYRSVLMIYSPLLKRSRFIKGVNSHLDIAPSFYNLLQNEYEFSELDSVSWLGKPFDTSHVFHSDRDILFMLNDRRTENILHKDLFYSKGILFKLDDRLKPSQIEDKEQEEFLEKLLLSSTIVHDEVVSQDALIPYKSDLDTIEITNKQVSMSKETEYGGLFSTVLLKAYKEIAFEFNIELEDGWNPEKSKENQPLLICSVTRGKESILWDKIDFKLDQLPVDEHRSIRYLLKSNLAFDLLPGDEVSVYFWNKERQSKTYTVNIHPLKVLGKAK